MFTQINKRAFYRQKHLDAPLLEERIQYLQHLKDNGVVLSGITSAAAYLLRIIELLPFKSRRIVTYDEIEAAAEAWAKYQCNHPQKRQTYSKNSWQHFIWHTIDWLKLIGCLERPTILHEILGKRLALKRHLAAPFLKERIQYLEYWKENGASINTLKEEAHYLLRVIEYTNLIRTNCITIDEIKKAANTWGEYQIKNYHKKIYDVRYSRKRFTKHACSWLKMLGYLKLPAKKPEPFAAYLQEYINHIRCELGYSEETIYTRVYLLKNFLRLVWSKTHQFKKITILTIDEVLSIKKNTDNYSRRSIQDYATVLRSFLRYAEQRNWCKLGLADAIKLSRTYKHEALPYSPTWNDVKKIIATTEGDQPTNIRDRAILLLLSVYGLRRIEVARLTLDDIDWQKEEIHFNRAKSGKPQTFPLSATVGEAILRYIKEIRPSNVTFRNIFACRQAPLRPLGAESITAIVSRRWEPLGVKIKHHGPHSLRHACATHLINEGVTLKEISNHLGHSDMEATRIYAKVDLVNLRKVTDFDMGDLL